MHTDQFEVRLAIVRHRLATTLESKIEAAIVSADHMSRGRQRRLRQARLGILPTPAWHLRLGPTVGFSATGEAAHFPEATLMQAHREERGLTDKEVLNLKKAMEHFRVVAASELRLMYQRGG